MISWLCLQQLSYLYHVVLSLVDPFASSVMWNLMSLNVSPNDHYMLLNIRRVLGQREPLGLQRAKKQLLSKVGASGGILSLLCDSFAPVKQRHQLPSETTKEEKYDRCPQTMD